MADKTFHWPEDGYILNSRTALVDNAAGKTSKIKGLQFGNISPVVDVTVTLYVTKANGGSIQSALTDAMILGSFTVPASKSAAFPLDYPIVLTAEHDAIQAVATTTNLVTALIAGVEV